MQRALLTLGRAVLVGLLAVLAGVHRAEAVTITGDVTVPGDYASPWNAGLIVVGFVGGDGTLRVVDGGRVYASGTIIAEGYGLPGKGAATNGTITVDGAGSLFFGVSHMGGGNYAYLDPDGFTFGMVPSPGSVGTLNITNGGDVWAQGNNTYIGAAAGATGIINVDGAGSRFTNQFFADTIYGTNTGLVSIQDGVLYVGYYGAGTLNVTNGGSFNWLASTSGLPDTNYAHFGYFAGSTGAIKVDGAGSNVTIDGTIDFGNPLFGGSGSLTITNGGTVDTGNGKGFINGVAYSHLWNNSTALVDGTGSYWSTGGLTLDNNSTLTITHGGSVSSTGGGIYGTATIDGTDSTWTAGGGGGIGGGGVLNITNGGYVSGGSGTVGQVGGSRSNVAAQALVDGADSLWRLGIGGSLTVGDFVDGTLTVSHGGSLLTYGTNVIGDQPGVNGAVTIDGSTWDTFGGRIVVGNFGNGTLTLSGGGVIDAPPGLRVDVGIRSALIAQNGGGTINGNVFIGYGGTLQGASGSVLTVNGNLSLLDGSRVNVALGAPSATGLFNVAGTGNITASGVTTVNVSDAGGFKQGLYRLFDYGGTLGGNDTNFTIGATPGGYLNSDLAVQTAVDHQINLFAGAPSVAAFWDGATTTGDGTVHGGSGTWDATTTNWTQVDGSVNHSYDRSALLIFTGTPGTVTVQGEPGFLGNLPLAVGAGLQFAVDGYVVRGDGLLTGAAPTELRVGDGTAASAGMTATIESVFVGAGDVSKTGLGTLVLTGGDFVDGNTYVTAGTLKIAQGGVLGPGGFTTNTATVDGAASDKATMAVDGVGSSGAASTWNTNRLTVGDADTGALNLTNGGYVHTIQNAVIGAQAGGRGKATVDGADGASGNASRWDVTGALTVGDAGTGALNITNGGYVSSNGTAIGGQAGSNGAVTVDGSGSTWKDGLITVGDPSTSPPINGRTGSLTLSNGGHVSTNIMQVGFGGSLIAQNGGGTITGSDVEIDGGTLVGVAGSVLNINSSTLVLARGATVNVALGAQPTTGLFNVSGNLIAQGSIAFGTATTVNVSDAGNFGLVGLYRLFDYGGTLGGNDTNFTVGTMPDGYVAGDMVVQTAVAHQINLYLGGVNTPTAPAFWDGATTIGDGVIHGGTGTWDATTTNWTNVNGIQNGAYDHSALLVFTGAPGTVTVDAGGLTLPVGAGLQFAVDGYAVKGDALGIVSSQTELRVGDGTDAGAGYTATIDSILFGGLGGIHKTDLGTLILTSSAGLSPYGGGTTVDGGTLVLAQGANLSGAGNASIGDATGSNGTVQVQGGYNATIKRITEWDVANLIVGNAGTGELDLTGGGSMLSNGSSVIGNAVGSNGKVMVDGAGVLNGVLTPSEWDTKGVLVVGEYGAGTLEVTGGGQASSRGIVVLAGLPDSTGTVKVDGAGSTWTALSDVHIGDLGEGRLTITNGGIVYAGGLAGFGVIGSAQGSTGIMTVDGAGSAWVSHGDLTVGNLGDGTLIVSNGGMVTVGSLLVAQLGTGKVVIGGLQGGVAQAPGTLHIDSGTVQFGIAGMGTLEFQHNDSSGNYVFSDAISGAGAVRLSAGTTVLDAVNGYTGGTTLAAPNFPATLQLYSGSAQGTVGTGDFLWNGGGAINMQLGAAGAVTGAVSGIDSLTAGSSGAFVFRFSDGDKPAACGETYTLVSASAITGFAASDFSYSYSGATPNFNGTFSIDSATHSVRFTANCAQVAQYTLKVSVSGSGSVSDDQTPHRISACTAAGGACTGSYDENTGVTLSATPATGYVFVGWGGDCTGAAPTAVVAMSKDRNCTARFATERTLSVSVGVGGSVSDDQTQISACTSSGGICTGGYADGTVVILTATPTAGYTFSAWGGDCAGSALAASVTMSANRNCTATFTSKRTLTVSVNNGGSVSDDQTPKRIDVCTSTGGTCTASYADGTTVTLTATAAAGYTFSGWGGDCSGGTVSTSVTISATRNCTAAFRLSRVTPGEPVPVPALTPWMLALLVLLLGGVGWRKAVTSPASGREPVLDSIGDRRA
jgi:fibronectin-binding autotransporter adhesin